MNTFLVALNREIKQISERNGIKKDAAFVYWFINAYFSEKQHEILESLTGKDGGQKGEKNCDAVFIDHKSMKCIIIQGKLRESESKKESLNDVNGFASLGLSLFESKNSFDDFRSDLEPNTKSKIEEVYNLVKKRGYGLRLFYITTGSMTDAVLKQAKSTVKIARKYCEIDFFVLTNAKLKYIFKDYIEGIAPAVQPVKLKIILNEKGIKQDGVIHRYDTNKKIETWIISCNGKQIGDIYNHSDIRVFAKNIRGYLSNTDINESIAKTIQEEPDNFWYYNNGITIICDDVQRIT